MLEAMSMGNMTHIKHSYIRRRHTCHTYKQIYVKIVRQGNNLNTNLSELQQWDRLMSKTKYNSSSLSRKTLQQRTDFKHSNNHSDNYDFSKRNNDFYKEQDHNT